MFWNIMLLETVSSIERMHVNDMHGTQIDVYVLPRGGGSSSWFVFPRELDLCPQGNNLIAAYVER